VVESVIGSIATFVALREIIARKDAKTAKIGKNRDVE
jgi:hypothetical protein